jgi:hypothetical protein
VRGERPHRVRRKTRKLLERRLLFVVPKVNAASEQVAGLRKIVINVRPRVDCRMFWGGQTAVAHCVRALKNHCISLQEHEISERCKHHIIYMESTASVRLQIGVALGTIGVLAWCSIQNRRAGWPRERSDVIMDTLMLWVAVGDRDDDRNQSRPVDIVTTPSADPSLKTSLVALGQVLERDLQSCDPSTVTMHSIA